MASKIVGSIRNRILIPFRHIPKDGLSPAKIAFSITLGILAGIFPVIGGTSLLGLLLAAAFRQNLFVVQSVQWLLAVVQNILIVPFMKFRACELNIQPLHINIEQIKIAFQPGNIRAYKNWLFFDQLKSNHLSPKIPEPILTIVLPSSIAIR